MCRYLLISFMLFGFSPIYAQSGEVKVVSFSALDSLYRNKSDDTTYVVHFFASWCRSCMLEFAKQRPIFSELRQNAKVKIVLVSLDFKRNYEKNLVPALVKYKIAETVYLLDESNPNIWIPKLDLTWSGALPATLLFTKPFKKPLFIKKDLKKERGKTNKSFVNEAFLFLLNFSSALKLE